MGDQSPKSAPEQPKQAPSPDLQMLEGLYGKEIADKFFPNKEAQEQAKMFMKFFEGLYGKELAAKIIGLEEDEKNWKESEGAYELAINSNQAFAKKVENFIKDGPKDSFLRKSLVGLKMDMEKAKVESSTGGGFAALRAQLGPLPGKPEAAGAPASVQPAERVVGKDAAPVKEEWQHAYKEALGSEYTPEQLKQFATEVMAKPNWRQYMLDTILSHDDEDARSKIFDIGMMWQKLGLPQQFAQWQDFMDKFEQLSKSAYLKLRKLNKERENQTTKLPLEEVLKLAGIDEDLAQFSKEFAGVKLNFKKEWAYLMFIDCGLNLAVSDAIKEVADFSSDKEAQAKFAAEILKNQNWQQNLINSLSDPKQGPKIAILAFSEDPKIPLELRDFLKKIADFEVRAKQKFEDEVSQGAAKIDLVFANLEDQFKKEFPGIVVPAHTIELLISGAVSHGKLYLEFAQNKPIEKGPDAGTAVAGSPSAKPTDAAAKPSDKPADATAAKPGDSKKTEGPKSKAVLASEMSMGQLIQELFKSGMSIVGAFGDFWKGGPKEMVRRAGNGFKEDEKSKITKALDMAKALAEADAKKYKGPAESVKYVANALHLPERENAQKFLTAFTTSGFNLKEVRADMLKPNELEVGDLLFFQKPNEKVGADSKKGPPEVYLTGIVSEVTPGNPPKIKMKTVLPNETEPREETVNLDNPRIKDQFKGYLKTHQSQPEAAPATTPPASAPQAAPAPATTPAPTGAAPGEAPKKAA